jgi:hypothetical protein
VTGPTHGGRCDPQIRLRLPEEQGVERKLSGILGLAVRDRRLAVNPALGVALPPMQEKRRRYLTAEQLEALAVAGPGRTAVLVLGYCGLRWSELAALRVRHFDLLRRRGLVEEAVTEVDGSRLVWDTPKTHGRRSVPLPRFLVDELARTVVTRPADELASPRRRARCCATATPAPPGSTPRPGPSESPASHRTNSGTPRPRWRSRPAPTSRPCSGCSGTPRRP